MKENFDKKRILETLIDPEVSIILAELEDGEKDLAYLMKKLGLTYDEIIKRLSYVIEHQFVKVTQNEGATTLNVDKKRLDNIMESDENFVGIVNGLTELDQYLN